MRTKIYANFGLSRRDFLATGVTASSVASAAAQAPPSPQPASKENSTMLEVDFQKLVTRADLNYEKPASRSEEGLPIGNGRMGTLVWTTPTTLRLQINRPDVFGMNKETCSFPERHMDYSAGCGFVDIDLVDYGDDVFTTPIFRQHLGVYDALMTARGNGIAARALAWHERDIIAVEVDDQRHQPETVKVDLRMLRYMAQYFAGKNWEYAVARTVMMQNRNQTAASTLDIRNGRIVLTQVFREGDFYNASAVAIAIAGRKSQAKYVNDFTVRVSAMPGKGRFTILIGSAATFDPRQDVAALAIQELEAAEGRTFDQLAASNRHWWHDYWSKAFVHIESADGAAEYIEQNYTYFLYIMGSTSRGAYPPRFGGLLFGSNRDMREWGAQQWWHNLSCYYDALPPANRPDIMDPVFSMYSGMYHSLAVAARQQWGSRGIFVPETVWFDGLEELPQSVGREMQDLYLLRKRWEERSERFLEFAATKHPHSSPWNWRGRARWTDGRFPLIDKGAGPYGEVNHIFSSGAKVAYLYWVRYEVTRDTEWLRDRAYPMLKGVAEFYRNYPKFKKDVDGRFHLHDVNDHEPVKGAQDPLEEMTAMHFIFPSAIRAATILNVDPDLRAQWKEVAANLAPIPTNDLPDAMDPRETGQPRMFCNGRKPVIAGRPTRGSDHLLIPAVHYGLLNAGSKNTELLKVANHTFDSVVPGGATEKTAVSVLSRVAIAAAHLGRAADVRHLIPNQIRSLEPARDFCDWAGLGKVGVMANRLTLREGPGAISAQRLGRASAALHLALLQSAPPEPGADPIIHVFPSWPKEWDAAYTLVASGAFLVTSEMREGRIRFVELKSQAGGECRLRNPWGSAAARLFRNGTKSEELSGPLLRFGTAINEVVVAVPEGETPARHKHAVI